MPEIDTYRLVYQQVEKLWDDQVDLAKSLVDKRKFASTFLAILLGLGLFRLQFHRSVDEVATVVGAPLLLIQVLLIGVLACYLAGAYYLFTERPVARRLIFRTWDFIRGWTIHSWRLARTGTKEEEQQVRKDGPLRRPLPWPSGRAIALLLEDNEKLEDWLALQPIEVIEAQTRRLRASYKRLVLLNRMVAARLRMATAFFLLGLFLLVIAFVVYLFAIG